MRDKLKQYVLLRQDLLEEKKQLEERLNEINLVLEGTSGPAHVPRGKRGRRKGIPHTNRRGKVTTAAAIRMALEGGATLGVKAIAEKVHQTKGKVSKPSINQGLMQLKKAGEITSPARGQYRLKK